MNPWELRKAAITALASGNEADHAKYRALYDERDADTEFDLLYYTVAACLAHRLGPPDQGTNRNALGRLMAEIRGAGPEWRPPSNFLEAEALIRGLRGQTHLVGEIPDNRLPALLRFLLRYLHAAEPEICEQFDTMLERAREAVLCNVIGVKV